MYYIANNKLIKMHFHRCKLDLMLKCMLLIDSILMNMLPNKLKTVYNKLSDSHGRPKCLFPHALVYNRKAMQVYYQSFSSIFLKTIY